MQIEKALVNDCLSVLKVSWKFYIPTVYYFFSNLPVKSAYFLIKVAYFLGASIVFSVYKQNFTAQ